MLIITSAKLLLSYAISVWELFLPRNNMSDKKFKRANIKEASLGSKNEERSSTVQRFVGK